MLTLESVLSVMRQFDNPPIDPLALNFCGMRIIEAREFPMLQLSKDFKWCRDEFREEMNLWLLKTFGTRSVLPKDTAYILAGRYAIMRPENIVKIVNVT